MIWVMIVALVAGLILLAVIGSGAGGGRRQTGRGSRHLGGSINRDLVAQRWAAIQAMTGGSGLRDAVSEADKLLDYALKHSGARGETMGERLKSSGSRFSDINAIWRAHKLRNALAHEAEFDLVASQAREAIKDFECGLRDLGAL